MERSEGRPRLTLATTAPLRYPPTMLDRLKQWARALKRDVLALYLAARDPRVPWYAKALALVTAAYALSPIDLIPDFVPVLGYLDDLILLPGLIWLTVRLIPTPLMLELRAEATARLANARPVSRTAAIVIGLLWIAAAALLGSWLLRRS
ncbi:MAG: YkvA family protein [Geminicoccaceae bacterium]